MRPEVPPVVPDTNRRPVTSKRVRSADGWLLLPLFLLVVWSVFCMFIGRVVL